MVAAAVAAGVVVTAGCAAAPANSAAAPGRTVSSDAQCSTESWQHIADDAASAGGAIWVGTVTASDRSAQAPLTDGSPYQQTFTRVDTTVESVLAGTLHGDEASGWVPGGIDENVVTEDNGSAWADDGRALIVSFPSEDPDTSPRVDIAPIVGDNVITAISPCFGPRNLTALDPVTVSINVAGGASTSAVGQPVPLSTFESALARH